MPRKSEIRSIININSQIARFLLRPLLTRKLLGECLLQLMVKSAIDSVAFLFSGGHEEIDKRDLESAITGSSGASSCSSLVHVLPQVAATAATGAVREVAASQRQFYILLLLTLSQSGLRRERCLKHVE